MSRDRLRRAARAAAWRTGFGFGRAPGAHREGGGAARQEYQKQAAQMDMKQVRPL